MFANRLFYVFENVLINWLYVIFPQGALIRYWIFCALTKKWFECRIVYLVDWNSWLDSCHGKISTKLLQNRCFSDPEAKKCIRVVCLGFDLRSSMCFSNIYFASKNDAISFDKLSLEFFWKFIQIPLCNICHDFVVKKYVLVWTGKTLTTKFIPVLTELTVAAHVSY